MHHKDIRGPPVLWITDTVTFPCDYTTQMPTLTCRRVLLIVSCIFYVMSWPWCEFSEACFGLIICRPSSTSDRQCECVRALRGKYTIYQCRSESREIICTLINPNFLYGDNPSLSLFSFQFLLTVACHLSSSEPRIRDERFTHRRGDKEDCCHGDDG